jgi:hypothetical protein
LLNVVVFRCSAIRKKKKRRGMYREKEEGEAKSNKKKGSVE